MLSVPISSFPTPWPDISEQLKEHDKVFTPCEPRLLKFYNKKRKCVKAEISTKLLYFSDYTHPYFRTGREYLIGVNNELMRNEQDQYRETWWMENDHGYSTPYSFIEVFNENQFITRHYVRQNRLTPFSYNGPVSQDPYISLPLTSDTPLCDWRKVMRWGQPKRSGVISMVTGSGIVYKGEAGMGLGGFVRMYKRKK